MQHILSSEELVFMNLLEADFSWSNQEQFASESKDDPYLIVIVDMSIPSDREIAESIARLFFNTYTTSITFWAKASEFKPLTLGTSETTGY